MSQFLKWSKIAAMSERQIDALTDDEIEALSDDEFGELLDRQARSNGPLGMSFSQRESVADRLNVFKNVAHYHIFHGARMTCAIDCVVSVHKRLAVAHPEERKHVEVVCSCNIVLFYKPSLKVSRRTIYRWRCRAGRGRNGEIVSGDYRFCHRKTHETNPRTAPLALRWFSARELSLLQLAGLPKTREGVSKWFARERSSNPDGFRPRFGRGGGWEIVETALPEAARSALETHATG
ncbi:MAG: hypothetical protein KGL46_13120 [Hyphomicrobiales bacterium]|nr:hypothetical protein [Hyphomicrobiales bacterium]